MQRFRYSLFWRRCIWLSRDLLFLAGRQESNKEGYQTSVINCTKNRQWRSSLCRNVSISWFFLSWTSRISNHMHMETSFVNENWILRKITHFQGPYLTKLHGTIEVSIVTAKADSFKRKQALFSNMLMNVFFWYVGLAKGIWCLSYYN